MLDAQPDYISVWTEEGQDRNAADVFVELTPIGFDLHVTAPNVALTRITLRWQQTVAPHTRILGDHWERGYGDLEWRGFVPERVMPWYALLFDPKTGRTSGIGVATGAASFASWRVDEKQIRSSSLPLNFRRHHDGCRSGGPGRAPNRYHPEAIKKNAGSPERDAIPHEPRIIQGRLSFGRKETVCLSVLGRD